MVLLILKRARKIEITPQPPYIKGEQDKEKSNFSVKTNKGEYKTKTILIATGGTRRKLDIPGAKNLKAKA